MQDYTHTWHLVDAERNIECRIPSESGQTVELRYSGGETEVLSWSEFSQWRGGGDDES